MGTYDGEKLVGMAQLYLEESAVQEIKEKIHLQNDKVVELGGYVVLEEYRNQGIMKKIGKFVNRESQRVNTGIYRNYSSSRKCSIQ